MLITWSVFHGMADFVVSRSLEHNRSVKLMDSFRPRLCPRGRTPPRKGGLPARRGLMGSMTRSRMEGSEVEERRNASSGIL